MRMKKVLLFLVITTCFVSSVGAAEKEEYYINQKGTVLSDIEYNNILKLNGKEMLENMDQETLEKYSEFYSDRVLEIETKYVESPSEEIVPLASFYETNYKKLSLSTASSGTNKIVVVTLKWKSMPKVRSYDILGVRLENTTFQSSIDTIALFDGTSNAISGSKQFTNGYGASIKLPSSCSSITIQQMFKVSTGGTVYASYQHSTRNITLSKSLDFTISSTGIGSVFNFGNNELFDQMTGVHLSV